MALKVEFGEYVLAKLNKPQNQQLHWWALGRVASRVAFYGSQHNVIPRHIVETWLNTLLDANWQKEPHIAFAAVMIARKTGDREMDIQDKVREAVLDKLTQSKLSDAWLALVRDVQLSDDTVMKRIFGDSLPTGLTLLS